MQFKHARADADGRSPPEFVGLSRRREAAVADSGEFTVPDDLDGYDAVVERFIAAGHEPLGDTGDDGADGADADGPPPAVAFTESELVAMDRNGLRALAAQYEHINGNASGDKLTEELIAQRRREGD